MMGEASRSQDCLDPVLLVLFGYCSGPGRSGSAEALSPIIALEAAGARGPCPLIRFAQDSALEEARFEPSVPPEIGIVWCFASSASRGAADEAVVKGRLLGQPGPDMPEVSSSLLDPQEGVLGPVNSIHMLLGGFTVRRAVISSGQSKKSAFWNI